MRHIAIVLLGIAASGLLLAGCGPKRPSVIAGPPIDFVDAADREEIDRLITSAEVQLGSHEDYYLGPGDVISIQLLGRADILQPSTGGEGLAFTLTDSPYLTLPLIGAVQVHKKTPGQLQEDLRVAYSEFVRDPQPLVIVREFSRNTVTVLGAVRTTGSYPFNFGDTVLDVIFAAGGLNIAARSGGSAPGRYLKIYRERLTAEQTATMTLEEMVDAITEDGRIVPREEIVIPIEDLLFNGVLEYNVPLRQNDIVYVLPAGTINMQGRVRTPGITFLGPSLRTVAQAITERGGLRLSADPRIEVVRTYPDGQNVSYFMNARKMIGHSRPDFTIRDGDEIFVYTTLHGEILELVDQIVSGSIRAGANYTYSPSVGP